MKVNLVNFARRTSLRQLRAFGAVARSGSVTGAARLLAVTPPAIAQQLGLLEDTLGVALLEKSATGARPTDAGREVLTALARIEAALQDCAAAIESLRGVEGGRVAVGVISTAKYFAPFALAAFQRAYPKVEMRILVGNRRQTISALENFETDLAITGRPPADFPIERAVIGDNPHVIIAPPDHRLAHCRGTKLRDVATDTFLLREEGSGTRELMGRAFAEAEAPLPRSVEIGSNESIKQAVMAGMGVALLSCHTIAAEVKDERLIVLDVEGFPIVRQWFVVRRSEKRLLPAAQALWNHLVTAGARFLPEIPAGAMRRQGRGGRRSGSGAATPLSPGEFPDTSL